ncbi:MAG: iron ABC transporter permease [Anaerolineae bacterium]|jgi:thiamine transport system permease protein|nr:iron ABC transporter permease [Anaerolineae bacterium]MBT7072234.1 iron ABC transporter permease [Anaerolineae bacterium]MBT7323982.1 iron ABC transporter permease [Anaerolineae bacterium]
MSNRRDAESAELFSKNAKKNTSKSWRTCCLGGSFFRWLPALLFLGLFFFYPLVKILALGVDSPDFLALESLKIAADSLGFTLWQALLSMLLTLLVGLPAAYLFARYDFRGKSLLRALTAVPFMLPTVVVAAGFNALLGARGWLNLSLMNLFDLETPPITVLYTLGAILLAHVFYNTTIVIRVVGNALSRLDPRLNEAARMLGGNRWKVFWQVTFPLLRPSIFAAALLVFLFDFTSFGVILLLGGPSFATIEVEIYIQTLSMLNLSVAALLSIIQLLCTLAFSILYSRMLAKTAVQTAQRESTPFRKRAKSLKERFFIFSLVSVLIALFVLPMLALPLRSVSQLDAARGERSTLETGFTTDYYEELFINRRGSRFYVPPIQAAQNSLQYAGITVALSLLLGFPVASALSKPTRLDRALDPILMLPLGASAVTLGLGFIIAFSRPPLNWIASPFLVPLAHTMIALPFVIRSLQPALASIPQRYREAAAMLGASPLRVWMEIDFPIIFRASLAAATFAFTVSLGEFGATSLLARPAYPTIPTAIYRFLSQPGGLNYGQAMAMATILMALTTFSILLVEKLRLPGTGEW